MKFRKKPVVIEAVRCHSAMANPENTPWFERALASGVAAFANNGHQRGILLKTLEGDMFAAPDDWIIKGAKDEIYPCKPDTFEAIYECVL